MKTDRRGFLKALTGGLVALAGGRAVRALPAASTVGPSIADLVAPLQEEKFAYFRTYTDAVVSEDLSQVIYNISPRESPFLHMIGNATEVSGRLSDWQLDPLTAELHAKTREIQDDVERVLLSGEPLREWIEGAFCGECGYDDCDGARGGDCDAEDC